MSISPSLLMSIPQGHIVAALWKVNSLRDAQGKFLLQYFMTWMINILQVIFCWQVSCLVPLFNTKTFYQRDRSRAEKCFVFVKGIGDKRCFIIGMFHKGLVVLFDISLSCTHYNAHYTHILLLFNIINQFICLTE